MDLLILHDGVLEAGAPLPNSWPSWTPYGSLHRELQKKHVENKDAGISGPWRGHFTGKSMANLSVKGQVTTMKYEQPTLVVLGSAANLVQGAGNNDKGNLVSPESHTSAGVWSSGTAYQADE